MWQYYNSSISSGGSSSGSRSSGGSSSGGGCFTEEVPVRMADNTTKPIRTIVVGDEVMTVDTDGTLVPRPVTAVFVYPAQEIVMLHTVRVTLEHPFVVSGGALKELKDIEATEGLVLEDGSLLRDWTLMPIEDHAVVYNIEVEELHSFIAGSFRVGDNTY